MATYNCNVTLVNNTIVLNSTNGTGGGICTMETGSTFAGVNNIIVFNASGDNTQYGTMFGGGASSLTYSCISQDMPGIGNINDTPMFVNATIDDYHLSYGSPCIDAGDPASPPDPDGTRADMGALYFDQVGIGGTGDPVSMFEMYPVSPNPFSAIVNIAYSLPHDGNVRIIVYDIMGRKVVAVTDRYSTSGFYSEVWDGRNTAGQKVESGIYFCRCEFDGAAQSKQLILIGD